MLPSPDPAAYLFKFPNELHPNLLLTFPPGMTATQRIPLFYTPPAPYLMQSNGQHRTVGSPPSVRIACEPCHERKIRCIISIDGGPCDSCQSRRLSCFFLPRARSGRRSTTNPASETDNSSPLTSQSSSGSRVSQTQTPNSEFQSDHFDWNWTLPTKGLDRRPQSKGMPDLDRSLSNARMTNSFGLPSTVAQREISDLSQGDSLNLRLTDPSTFLATEMPSMTEHAPPPDPSFDHDTRVETKIGEKEFSTFMQLCTKLQRHVVLAGELAGMTTAISAAHLQEMMGDIDRSCDVIFDVYGQDILSRSAAQLTEDLDHASVSLAMALIFKIFQVCDVVLGCNLSKNQGMNDMFLHKRLDFNLTQASIAISKIQELTQGGFAISRGMAVNASYIENKFRAIS